MGPESVVGLKGSRLVVKHLKGNQLTRLCIRLPGSRCGGDGGLASTRLFGQVNVTKQEADKGVKSVCQGPGRAPHVIRVSVV